MVAPSVERKKAAPDNRERLEECGYGVDGGLVDYVHPPKQVEHGDEYNGEHRLKYGALGETAIRWHGRIIPR